MDTITKTRLSNIAQSFIESEVRPFLEATLGGDRVDLALDLENHKTYDQSGNERDRFEIEHLLERCYKFAVEAQQGGDDQADQEELDALKNVDLMSLAIDSTLEERSSTLGRLLTLHEARMTLEFGEPDDTLTREEIAALSGLAIETVRLAAFSDGDDRLAQERPGVAKVEDVKRWLIHKNRYEALKRLPDFILSPDSPAGNESELAEVLRMQAHRLLNKTSDVDGLFPKEDLPGWLHFFQRRRFDPLQIDWVTPENALELGAQLKLDAHWLFENLHRLASESQRKHLLETMDGEALEDSMPEAPTNVTVTRELIRKVFQGHPLIERHPAQHGPNKKLDGYRVRGGPAFAHQHNGKSQFLWVPESVPLPGSAPAQHYPAVGASEPVARHSGLIKFPELGREAVKKVQVKNSDMLNEIVGMLLGPQDEA